MLLVFNVCIESLSQIPSKVNPLHLHGHKHISDSNHLLYGVHIDINKHRIRK